MDPGELEVTWLRCQEHWRFAVPQAVFVAAVAASESAEGMPLDAEEVYLAAGCHLKLAAAILGFEREYISRIPQALRRQGFSADKIDEAMQRVRSDLLTARDEPMIRLCRYAGSGRLASLVRVSATRYARRAGSPSAACELGEILAANDTANDVVAGQLGDQFKQAFAIALGGCTTHEKLLLRMVFVENLAYREVADLLCVSKSTVCRQLVDLERRLVKQLTALWRQRTNAAITDDLGEIIACELDLSFSRLLRAS